MFNKSVDSIVSVFTKAITELSHLEEKHIKVNEVSIQAISSLEQDIRTRDAEIARSKAVREKLIAITAGL